MTKVMFCLNSTYEILVSMQKKEPPYYFLQKNLKVPFGLQKSSKSNAAKNVFGLNKNKKKINQIFICDQTFQNQQFVKNGKNFFS